MLALIGLNGLCVAGEFALIAADRSKIELRADGGSRSARLTLALLDRLSFHLAGAQFGITVTSLVLGLIAEDTIGAILEMIPGVDSVSTAVVVVASLAVATALQMILGELAPKNLAVSRPQGTSLALAPFLTVYGVIASPIIAAFNGAANWIVRLFGVEPREELPSHRSLDELEYVVRTSADQGTLADHEVALLIRTMALSGRDAADALTPRPAMHSVHRDDPVGHLIDLADETGFSRFPVLGDGVDDVRGVVDVRDVFRLPTDQRYVTPVSELARDPIVVPESRELDGVLQDMLGVAGRMAVVVDEHGGTAGLITLEDILEELVGDIVDEYDDEVSLTATLRGDVFVVDGGLRLHEVAELVGVELPDGPYETLAGFVLDRLGAIPEVGDELEWSGWHFTVTARERLRVATVEMRAEP